MRTCQLLSLGTLLFSALVLFSAACGDDVEGSCERIAEACHPLDTGSGVAHDCHELAEAEDATDESCAESEDECLDGCVAAE
jgi:hypothetical protein